MAYIFGFRLEGLTTRNDGATLPYRLVGETSQSTARAYVIASTPTTFGVFRRKDVQLRHIGVGIWDVDVEYSTPEKQEPQQNTVDWTFDTTGKTKHITQGLSHVATYPSSGAPFDHKGAIGVTDDSVEGVNVPDRSFKWTETWNLPVSSYGFVYSAILGELTGRTNTSYFRGFPSYTVQFCGATGGRRVGEDLELREFAYSFEVSPTETNRTVGDITGINKTGWDYLWVRYQQADNTEKACTELKPAQVEVDRVLQAFNFSLLGIGSGILA